jgi:hypothetical protein
MAVGTKGADADVKHLFQNLKLERDKERVIVSAEVPLRFLQKLASEAAKSQRGEAETPGKKEQTKP